MSEVRQIKAGIIPEGRTYHAVQQFCCRMKITFPGKRWRHRNVMDDEPNTIPCHQCKKICQKKWQISQKFLCEDCYAAAKKVRENLKRMNIEGRDVKQVN